jgi:hypothetical protein
LVCGGGHLHKQCPEKGTLLQRWHAATASWRKWRKLTPPIIGAPGKQRKRFRKGSRTENPRLQREGCSLQSSPLQVFTSRRPSEAAHSSSGLRHARLQWQVQPQRSRGSLRPYTEKNIRQHVSQFGLLMQTVCL